MRTNRESASTLHTIHKGGQHAPSIGADTLDHINDHEFCNALKQAQQSIDQADWLTAFEAERHAVAGDPERVPF